MTNSPSLYDVTFQNLRLFLWQLTMQSITGLGGKINLYCNSIAVIYSHCTIYKVKDIYFMWRLNLIELYYFDIVGDECRKEFKMFCYFNEKLWGLCEQYCHIALNHRFGLRYWQYNCNYNAECNLINYPIHTIEVILCAQKRD